MKLLAAANMFMMAQAIVIRDDTKDALYLGDV